MRFALDAAVKISEGVDKMITIGTKLKDLKTGKIQRVQKINFAQPDGDSAIHTKSFLYFSREEGQYFEVVK